MTVQLCLSIKVTVSAHVTTFGAVVLLSEVAQECPSNGVGVITLTSQTTSSPPFLHTDVPDRRRQYVKMEGRKHSTESLCGQPYTYIDIYIAVYNSHIDSVQQPY